MDGFLNNPMQWHDKGIILSSRPYNESYYLASLLTLDHGRHVGMMRSRKKPLFSAQLQPGNLVHAVWSARLSESLGFWRLENEKMNWFHLVKSPKKLAALSCLCTLLDRALPERHPYPHLYQSVLKVLQILTTQNDWQRAYLQFELDLLACLGFGLTLNTCAVTRSLDNLTYVSPKSGHAVCDTVAKPYADRLLKLPAFLLDESLDYSVEDLQDAYRLTGYFLSCYIFENKDLPLLRQQLAA